MHLNSDNLECYHHDIRMIGIYQEFRIKQYIFNAKEDEDEIWSDVVAKIIEAYIIEAYIMLYKSRLCQMTGDMHYKTFYGINT